MFTRRTACTVLLILSASVAETPADLLKPSDSQKSRLESQQKTVLIYQLQSQLFQEKIDHFSAMKNIADQEQARETEKLNELGKTVIKENKWVPTVKFHSDTLAFTNSKEQEDELKWNTMEPKK